MAREETRQEQKEEARDERIAEGGEPAQHRDMSKAQQREGATAPRTFVTLDRLVVQIADVHEELARTLETLAETDDDTRVRKILSRMAGDEALLARDLRQAASDFDVEATSSQESRVKTPPWAMVEQVQQERSRLGNLGGEDATSLARDLSARLTRFFEELRVAQGEASEGLEAVIELERGLDKRHTRTLESGKDA